MSDAGHDLTGRWHGIFNYPDGSPPNSFEADLRDVGGVLTGETREASDGADDVTPEQTAFVEGSRTGTTVTFTKRYDEMHRSAVLYEGTLDDEAVEIAGRWTIPGVWSGSFIMIRPKAASIAAEEEVAAPVN